MHLANRKFWEYTKKEFSEYFNEDILEVGSYNINGSIRSIFELDARSYKGLDWREGPGVDVVSLAHKIKFENKFRAILSASMLEHDPYWKDSLDNMINHLSENGIICLTWGAALNPPHCYTEAPDGKFHSLKAELVIDFLKDKGLHINVLVYDCNLYKLILENIQCESSDGKGEINLIASYIPIIKYIDTLWPQDKL